MRFKLVDANRWYLPSGSKRMLHLASVHYGVREFMCFADVQTSQTYIEEITGGHLSFIEDDSLAESISIFLREKGILDISKPFMSDELWYKKK